MHPHARPRLALPLALLACCALAPAPAHAAPRVDFSRDVRPILAQHCLACHGFDKQARKAGLRLDLLASALARKAVVPGKPNASRLVARVESADPEEQMPPPQAGKPLSARQKQTLRAWVEQGAAYAQHWSFVPPRRPAPPAVKNPGWVRNPIDAFVLARLEREGMAPSPQADPATLLRRVTLDLTGLPPTVAELDAFLADRSPNAYERAVDRLLASPRFGERMALAWLDAARYADTNGFNNDEDRTQWPWRDWALDAFNANLPYDRFLLEQLAGDLLPGDRLGPKVATAFLRNQVHNTEGGIIAEEYRVEYVADRVHTTATVVLGLSLQCARCHDHKFDPVSQKDYYRFFAFFNNISDKPASYVHFVAAEPFLRAPSAHQQAQLDDLRRRRQRCEEGLRRRERAAVQNAARWETSLTPVDVRALGRAGLLLHLPLDGAKGGTVLDGANTARGKIHGKLRPRPGKVGAALEFAGGAYVEVSDGPSFEGDAPFSVALWAYPTAAGPAALLSKMDDRSAHRGYDVLLEGGKVAVHLVHRWPGDALKVLAKDPLSLDAWHHVVVAYDGSRKAAGVRLYLDGKPAALAAANDSLRGTLRTTQPLLLGKRQTSIPFTGRLRDVRIYGLQLGPGDASRLAANEPLTLASDLLSTPAGRRTPAQREQVRRLYLEHGDAEYRRLRADRADLARRQAALEQSFPALMVMREMAKPRETFVLARGQYDRPAEKVSPGVPLALPQLGAGAPANRLGLAQWVIGPDNPLTARVAVNRWWQMLFGTGLVQTVEDFGATGEPPSHPELLDHLAVELVSSGWDVKAALRRVVTSATYRQSSRSTPEQRQRDPANRLLGRGARYRLGAEAVRDNALAVAGLLRERLGGPSVKPYQPAGLWEDVTVDRRGRYVADAGEGLYRRSMYTFWKRTCPPPGLMTFDAPNREVCVARRAVTNTPLQALVLLNDPTYVEAARHLAGRMLREGGRSPRAAVGFGFRCATARPPTPAEVGVLLKVHARALARFRASGTAARDLLSVGASGRDATLDETELAACAVVASVILNLDETITRR